MPKTYAPITRTVTPGRQIARIEINLPIVTGQNSLAAFPFAVEQDAEGALLSDPKSLDRLVLLEPQLAACVPQYIGVTVGDQFHGLTYPGLYQQISKLLHAHIDARDAQVAAGDAANYANRAAGAKQALASIAQDNPDAADLLAAATTPAATAATAAAAAAAAAQTATTAAAANDAASLETALTSALTHLATAQTAAQTAEAKLAEAQAL